MSYKHLFQRALAAAPDRLRFAAHSHHLWPDASYLGQLAAWDDAALDADDIMTDVRGDVLRIGFGLYHDSRDVDRRAAALRRL